MAFTKAAEIAALVKRHVLSDVTISLGRPQGVTGVEIVIRGFSHPEDGMSRVWHLDLLGSSGMMLDLVIQGLRKAGFEMSGSAPLMKGTLTQVLSKAELSQIQQAAINKEKQQNDSLINSRIETANSVAEATNSEIEGLRNELERLKEIVEDMALLPVSRGPRGLQGEPGIPGASGGAQDLDNAELSDLGDVSGETPEERMVLTWERGQWRPSNVPINRISQIHAAGGSSGGGDGGGSLTVQRRDRDNLTASPTDAVNNVTALSFDSASGFEVQDLSDGTQEAFIKMNSTFNPWQVLGQTALNASGEEPVEFVQGNGIQITTDHTASPKKISFSVVSTSTGGVPTAPNDGNHWVRRNGSWVDLRLAISSFITGGNFTDGTSDSIRSYQVDGGNFTTGATDAGEDLT